MFAAIETNNATHIVIHVPADGAEKSLPALARLLEQNAVFVRQGYQTFEVVQPTMGITLGDTFKVSGYDETLAIAQSSAVIGDEFINATPDVLVSNAAYRKRVDAEQTKLRNELTFTKDQLARTQEDLSLARQQLAEATQQHAD